MQSLVPARELERKCQQRALLLSSGRSRRSCMLSCGRASGMTDMLCCSLQAGGMQGMPCEGHRPATCHPQQVVCTK